MKPAALARLATAGALVLVVAPAASGGGSPVTATLGLDPAFLAGTDGAGRIEVNTPNPVVLGSSVSHWTRLVHPGLLMRSFGTSDFGDDVDLTDEALADIGLPLGGGATIVVTTDDGAGEGFNDLSPPVLPAPGNPGATLGAQRLAAVQRAADLWAAIVQSPVTIEIAANFDSLPPCSPAGGTFFAFGGPLSMHADFTGAPSAGTWFTQAVANAVSGADQSPAAELFNLYNTDVDAACLGPGTGFYYGFDHAPPTGKIDLLTLALHEIAHGLGFLSLVDLTTGSFAGPPFLPDAYSTHLFDTTAGLHWDEMASDAERLASSVNTANLVFDGGEVVAGAPSILAPRSALIVAAPAEIAGSYEGSIAAFGAPLADPGVTAGLVCGFDGAGVSSTDACEPLTNLGDASGNLVIVDRGTCVFSQKATNVQAAGGVGMVVVNNVPGDPPQMAGPGPGVSIPLLMLPQADGEAIRGVACRGVAVLEVPTSGPAGLGALATLLLLAGFVALRRHRAS